MSRCFLLAAPLPLLVLAACQPKTETITHTYPKMVVGQGTLEFGEASAGSPVQRTVVLSNAGDLPMGVGTTDETRTGIDIGDGMAGFTVTYDAKDVQCPTDDGGSASRRAKGKGIDTDTGGGGGGGVDTGGSTVDTGDGGGGQTGDDRALFVLDSGCSIPITVTFDPTTVGETWGSLVLESVTAEQSQADADAGKLPDYLRDPLHYRQMVYLHGNAEHAQGTIIVSPRSYDFGFVYPGMDTTPARIAIQNVGQADVTLAAPTLSESCDTSFAIETTFADAFALAPGDSTLVEVGFNPDDTSASYCQVMLTSDDPANPSISVTLKGNAGTDPTNSPPTVAIRSPGNGYVYNLIGDLEMELNVFDRDQPATSLTCKIKSQNQGSSIATCTPGDESGHVFVSIPADDLDDGVDTLTVTVTDGSQASASASVSVLVNTAFPEDDDDGDGYSVSDEVPDCDDSDRETYPYASEVYDGADNDCDGYTDEGTEGYDDDGDGVSELDGDCNDDNPDAYPGGPERGDGVDNDCDGIVDEATSLYDDDGDGFAEVNSDCDDTRAEVSPAATEVCGDNTDNDCDGLTDAADGCVSTNSEPIIIGTIKPNQNACESGDKLLISVLAYDADGQVPTYQWNNDADGVSLFDNPNAQTVNFTCPGLSENSGGKAYNVYVVVSDTDLHQVWADDKIAVYPDGYGLYEDWTEVVEVKE